MGVADVGGAWTVSGGSAAFSVASGQGRITVPAGSTRTAALTDVNLNDTVLSTKIGLDSNVTGGGTYAAVIGRRVAANTDYRLKLRAQSTGTVTAQLVRVVGGAETTIQTVASLPGLSWVSGVAVQVRLEVTGASPTTLRARVWKSGSAEPNTWQLQATDATASLQVSGGVGYWSYVSSSATSPVSMTFDDLAVGGQAPPPPANSAPKASFTADCVNLVCSFDGADATDADGSVAGWSWSFGDDKNGTGTKVSHTYTSAGTFAVQLTVTDDDGATGVASKTVTVTAPPPDPDPGALFASDDFTRTTSSGWGSADNGGAWTTSSGASLFSTTGSVGRIALTTGSGPSIFLATPSVVSSDVRVIATTDKPATGGGTYATVLARRIAGQGDYRAKIRLISGGQVSVQLIRATTAGQENAIGSAVTVAGLSFAPQTGVRIRVQATGTSPTTIRAKVWAANATEPSAWTVSGSDSTAGLQSAGGIGLMGYLSSSATNAPIALTFDELRAGPVG